MPNVRHLLRQAALKVEPLAFRALSPLAKNRRARVQRSLVIQRHCKGQGLEIGGFTQPCLVPAGSHTTYVDRVPASHWIGHPVYDGVWMIDPDIVDDGVTLSTIPDKSYDYLIAAHMLEHADDVIAALKNWLRVVRSGGHIVIMIPDFRHTPWDAKRALTPVAHFFRDHEEGPHVSNPDHWRDIAINSMDLSEEAAIADYVALAEPAVHFHTFTTESFTELLIAANRYLGHPYELMESSANVNEVVAVLQVK